MEKSELKKHAEHLLSHLRIQPMKGSLEHYIETGTINGHFLEMLHSICQLYSQSQNKELVELLKEAHNHLQLRQPGLARIKLMNYLNKLKK